MCKLSHRLAMWQMCKYSIDIKTFTYKHLLYDRFFPHLEEHPIVKKLCHQDAIFSHIPWSHNYADLPTRAHQVQKYTICLVLTNKIVTQALDWKFWSSLPLGHVILELCNAIMRLSLRYSGSMFYKNYGRILLAMDLCKLNANKYIKVKLDRIDITSHEYLNLKANISNFFREIDSNCGNSVEKPADWPRIG